MNMMDVTTQELRDELGRRELSMMSEVLYQYPIETVDEYKAIRKDSQAYATVFRGTADPQGKGRRVALLFRLFDRAQEQKEVEKADAYKRKLDQEFACMRVQVS